MEYMYDRLVAATVKMLGREDLEAQLLLRIITDLSVPTDGLEDAILMAEEMK